MEVYQWYNDPSCKNFYETEIAVLKNGYKGNFRLMKLYKPEEANGRITAIGKLTFGANKEQGIQIVFPPKYPFAPPKVTSVNMDINDSGEIVGAVQPFNFNRGNQYGDNSFCLCEKDFWNRDEHNIAWALKRSQMWLESATSKEGFKPDEIIEEYPPFMQHTGQVLMPLDIKLPKKVRSGDLVLTQFKQNNYILEQNIIAESPFKLHINKEIFKWYSFDKYVMLKKLFPVFDGQNIINVFSKHFGENILEGSLQKNIAFHLPAEKNNWHFFKFTIQKIGNQVGIQAQYFLSRNISTELYLRTKDIFDDQILLKKRVTIIGLGAIGSEVATSMAKNGVGHFNLFDMDTFEIGNSIRHAADLYYVGEDKVNVVKQLIHRSNPNITVNSYKIDVLDDVGILEESLNNSDLCIVLTAEDSVDYLINDHYAKNFDIPFIFARASAGAFSGSVQIVDSKGACLRCLSKTNSDKLPIPSNKISFSELEPEYGSCSTPALPGSEIDTKEIALQVARVSIQSLMQNKNSAYPKNENKQFYWHGPYGSKEKEPFTWEMTNHKKHDNCKVCH